MSTHSQDEIKLDYLFKSILRDIAFMELFHVDSETLEVFSLWKKKYGKDINSINLLDLVQHVGKLFTVAIGFKSNFLNHCYHRHFLFDIEYFRYFLESKGSKTGDISSVMLRSCNNSAYKTNIFKDTYFMNILISICHIIIHSSWNLSCEIYQYILVIISNLKKTKNVYEQIKSIQTIVKKINASDSPLSNMVTDAVSHVTHFCSTMLEKDEKKNVSIKSEKEKKLDNLSESYQMNDVNLGYSFLSTNCPKSFLEIEDE